MAVSNVSANQIADQFVCFFQEHGDGISNLKLQKLLYYAQGWFLAIHGDPLFSDEIQAWVHGPVVPTVYQRFKKFQFSAISDQLAYPSLTDVVVKHLEEIIDVYGDHHAFVLERMSHKTMPWLKARGDIPADAPSTNTILIDDMKNYFKQKKLESGQQQADQRA